MKTNELMLGDIITFKDSVDADETPIPVKVIALGYQHHGSEDEALVKIGDDKTCDIVTIDDEFVGYPLTAGILEKNGFRNDFYEEESVADYHTIRLEGYSLKHNIGEIDGYLVTWCNGGLNVTTDFHGCVQKDISYVHELQHALRLCGIEKEIEL